MQRVSYKLVYIFLFILIICSCNSEKQNNERFNNEDKNRELPLSNVQFRLKPTEDSANYIVKSIHKEIDPVANSSEEQTKISIRYPYIQKFKNSAVKDSVNQIILELLLLNTADEIAYKTLEERLESFIREYKLAKKEMEKEFVLPSSWTCEVSIDILLNTDKILALKFFEMNYTGGVHPNSFTRYFNFNMEEGRLITLEDILLENYREDLLAKAEVYFKKAMKIDQSSPISSTLYEFPAGKFLLPRNFAITETGLLFCYNPYDIGPYSMGIIEFELPYDAILDILRQDILN